MKKSTKTQLNVGTNGIIPTVEGRVAAKIFYADVTIDFSGDVAANSLVWRELSTGTYYEADFSDAGINRLTLQNVGATDGIWIDYDGIGANAGEPGVLMIADGAPATLTYLDPRSEITIRFVTPGTGLLAVMADF